MCAIGYKETKHSTPLSLFKKMYLYVLTYWCQKSMHRKCHIDSQLQRKSIFLFPQLQVLKNYVQKKGRGDKKVHEKQT